MYCSVCGLLNINDHLLLIGKRSSLIHGRGFISPYLNGQTLPYVRHKIIVNKELSASLNIFYLFLPSKNITRQFFYTVRHDINQLLCIYFRSRFPLTHFMSI